MSRKIRLWCRNSHIFWLFDSCLFTFCIILCHFWEPYKLFILEYMINDFAHSVSSEKIHNFHCSYFSKTSKENIISSKCSITCQCKLVWTCKSISSMTVWCVWNILLLYVQFSSFKMISREKLDFVILWSYFDLRSKYQCRCLVRRKMKVEYMYADSASSTRCILFSRTFQKIFHRPPVDCLLEKENLLVCKNMQ